MLFDAPQPLGIVPPPAGYLVLPSTTPDPLRQSVLQEGVWPAEVPEECHFVEQAHAGKVDAARQALKDAGSALWVRYNRFVLAPDADTLAALRAETDGADRRLVDTVAYLLHLDETVPGPSADDPPTLAAFLAATRAGALLEDGRGDDALDAYDAAVDAASEEAPAFAARHQLTAAELRLQRDGPSPHAIAEFKAALDALDTTALDAVRAEAWLQLGMIYHDLAGDRRGPLQEAVRCYQEALGVFSRDTHPEAFALAQNNLGLAYLAMPLVKADDQLRIAVAVQALREARSVYDRETQPNAWASTTMNLANALQRAPSSTPEDHLWQAVHLYEDVLDVRDPEQNPSAYARALANQGTALAHLGAFSEAVPRLTEAQALFRAQGHADAADALQDTLDDIRTRQSDDPSPHGAPRETTV